VVETTRRRPPSAAGNKNVPYSRWTLSPLERVVVWSNGASNWLYLCSLPLTRTRVCACVPQVLPALVELEVAHQRGYTNAATPQRSREQERIPWETLMAALVGLLFTEPFTIARQRHRGIVWEVILVSRKRTEC